MSEQPLRIFIGYDQREDEAYRVCAWSLRQHAGVPLDIRPLDLDLLRAEGLYRRTWSTCPETGVRIDDKDGRPFSTDFAFSRFLVPEIARREGFDGWALFCDCDFLFTADVAELFALTDPRYAIMCVQHDYQPPEGVKMDGQVQQRYRRKNWSSLVLWNCGSPYNVPLTGYRVNESQGGWLHAFSWLRDDTIGALPDTWNHLVGHTPADGRELPKGIHYTSGGPWFEQCQDVEYADVWRVCRDAMRAAEAKAA